MLIQHIGDIIENCTQYQNAEFKYLTGRVSDPDPYPDPHGSALI
jgi:hypothetical protein